MATVVRDTPYHDRRVAERRRIAYPATLRAEGMRVSWASVFGGVMVALGFLLLMTALGVAVGISAAQPGETDTGALGTGAGIWAGVSLLLALFIGGWVATRIGAIFDGTTGFFEGALVWIVSVLLMLYLASSGIGMLAGGAFKLVGGAAQALGSVVQSTPEMSGSVDQMIQRLKDPKTAEHIAAATGMPASEVQAAEAEEMKPQATRAAWITFGALLLSLLAAVLGAMAGRRNPLKEVKA